MLAQNIVLQRVCAKTLCNTYPVFAQKRGMRGDLGRRGGGTTRAEALGVVRVGVRTKPSIGPPHAHFPLAGQHAYFVVPLAPITAACLVIDPYICRDGLEITACAIQSATEFGSWVGSSRASHTVIGRYLHRDWAMRPPPPGRTAYSRVNCVPNMFQPSRDPGTDWHRWRRRNGTASQY